MSDAELHRQANEHFAFIAHELRNPLSAAISAFQLLQARTQLPAESRAVAELERGLDRTRDLIDRTLGIARIASGIELRRRATTLKVLYDDAELDAISEAEAKGVELRVSIEEDARVSVDDRLLHSALSIFCATR